MLVPPEGYSMVEMGIFRCSKLDAINISFLKCINLQSIIWIGEENPCRAIKQFIRDNNIKLHHLTSSGLSLAEEKANKSNQDWMVLRPSIINKAIELILNVENYNCLVMDTSEVIIGVLRSIQKWNYCNILDEYRLYSRKSSYKAATFLEMIEIDLIPNEEESLVAQIENTSVFDDAESDIEDRSVNQIDGPTLSSLNRLDLPVSNAISITRNIEAEPAYSHMSNSWQASSPTFRRLSSTYNTDKTGLSTSPQIPSALLRRAKRPNKSGSSKTATLESAPSTAYDETQLSPLTPTTTHSSKSKYSIDTGITPLCDNSGSTNQSGLSSVPGLLSIELPPRRSLPDWFCELQEYTAGISNSEISLHH